MLLTGEVQKDIDMNRNAAGYYEVNTTGQSKLNQFAHKFLFLTALANLEWSRGYTWYVELDDVPYPFQRGGVLGLPVTNITYQISNASSYSWKAGLEVFSVPANKDESTLVLDFYDDEQATLFTFFERWFNNVYNSHSGVLPLIEAAKCISIYKLKASRNPVQRYAHRYSDMDTSESILPLQKVPSRELLVYPTGPLQEQEKYESGPRSYSIEFKIVNQENADYGDPSIHEGEVFGLSFGGDKFINSKITNGSGFLDKVADYF